MQKILSGTDLAHYQERIAAILPKSGYDVGIGDDALNLIGEEGVAGAAKFIINDKELTDGEGCSGKIEATSNETGVVTMLYFRRYKNHVDMGTRKDMADLHLTDLCDELDAKEANDETTS